MLDIALLRKDLDAVVIGLQRRRSPQPFLDVESFKALESERKALQTRTEDLQARRNTLSKLIGQLKGKGADAQPQMLEVASVNEQLQTSSGRLEILQMQMQELLLALPNLPHESVPFGHDESGNVLVRQWGTPRRMNFTARDHVDIGRPLGLDLDMGAKLAGSRFVFMQGDMARLHRAIAAFMLDTQTRDHGYTECYTPYIVNADTLRGTGQLPKFEADLFAVKKGGQEGSGENLYLIPTSEVTLTNVVRDRIVNEAELPIRLTAHTPCFRSEAGSAGRDTRGMIRQHQFDKVEMVQIVHPEKSYQALEDMVRHAEAILQKLGLPYRVMALCGGDMGPGSAKTYDLEVWMPAQDCYREISSVSNCESFQARRMQARFRNAQGRTEMLHTLNGSGLAVGRTLVAILENCQNEDGSVELPGVLHAYLGGTKVMTAARI